MRFKGFEGEWRSYLLSDIASFSKGKGISKEDLSEEGVPCILYGELYTKYKSEVIKEVYSKTSINPEALVKSQFNDIIIPSSGESAIEISTARCIKLTGVLLGGDLNILRPYRDNGVFISYQLNGKRKYDIAKIAQGGSVTHLYNSSLKALRVTLPPQTKEQDQIANFIYLIDERIATQIKIIEELQLLKVELSNKIFSKQIRFQDEKGENFPEWQKKFFGDVYTFKVTNSFSRDNLTYENGSVRNIHYGDIHTKFSEQFDLNKEQVPFINEAISLDSIKADSYCQEGDLVFADASEDLTDVGKCIEITNLHNEKTVAGLHTLLARPKLSIIHKGFGVYMMKSKTVRKQIMKLAQGSKVSSISSTMLSSISINVPDIKEQIKISNLFSDISQKIDCERRFLKQYNIQKKYLLINLFI